MSTQDKPGKVDLARGWQALEKMAAEDEREWLEKASDEEVEARMNEAGVKVERTPSAEEILARMKERAGAGASASAGASGAKGKVVPLSRRATPYVVGLALAAGFALVVSRAVRPNDEGVTSSPHEAATKLRSEAFAACDHQKWDDCEKLLDRAKQIEPEGEKDPGVVRARHVLQEMKPGGQK
jgi:hypothetical protein